MDEIDAMREIRKNSNFINLATNRIRFDANHYGADAIVKESKVH